MLVKAGSLSHLPAPCAPPLQPESCSCSDFITSFWKWNGFLLSSSYTCVWCKPSWGNNKLLGYGLCDLENALNFARSLHIHKLNTYDYRSLLSKCVTSEIILFGRSLLFGSVLNANSMFACKGNLQTLCYFYIRLTFISIQNKLACSVCYCIQIFW